MKSKLILIVLMGLIIAGCDHNDEKIAQLTSDAVNAIEEANYDRAIKDYSEVIRLNRRFEPAYVARAGALVALHKYDQAIEDINHAIRLKPTNYRAYQIRGNAYLGKQQFDKAIADLSFALLDKSNDAGALERRGLSLKLRGFIYCESRSFTNAIADLTEAVKYLPDDYTIYQMRGCCYDLKTDADKAFRDFNKAIQLNAGAAIALYGRGRFYSQTGQDTNAIQDFKTVVHLKPQAHGAYNLLAWVLATSPDDSVRDGKQAVELATQACCLMKWTNYAYLDTLAAAYAETGDFDQAVKYQQQSASMRDVPEDNRTNVENRIQLYLQHKPYRKTKFKNYD